MKKYFFNDGTAQLGPFTLEELKDKNIRADTPVWYDGLEQWTTAGQLEELSSLLTPVTSVAETTTPAEMKKEAEQVIAAAATTAAAAPVATSAAPAPAPVTTTKPAAAKAGKKSTAWLSYVLALLVFGGLGYYIYQDMEKNKTASVAPVTNDSTVTTNTDTTTAPPVTTVTTNTTGDSLGNTTISGDTISTNPVTTPPVDVTTVTPTTKTTDPAALKKAEDEKKKLAAQKAAEEKKKQLAAAAKKEEERQKLILAQAAAREMEMRNNWPRYITIGALDYKEDDGIKSFPVPVYNATTAMLDKVTLRIDYIKKEGKVVGTETLVLTNVPAKGGLNAMAAGNKKARKANVYITGITSRKLHFCYPLNNGNAGDPYFCN